MKRENSKRASEIVSKIEGLEKTLRCIETEMTFDKSNGVFIKIEPSGFGVFSINEYISKEMKSILLILAKNEVEKKIKILETELEKL